MLGIRLNTYSDSVGPAAALRAATGLPAARSNAVGRSRNSLSTPRSYPFKCNDGCPILSERVPGSSFLRTCPGGGGSKFFSFRGDGRRPELPIKSTESFRAQRRPGVLRHQGVGSVTRKGIGLSVAPVRTCRLAPAGAKFIGASAPPPGAPGRRRFCF